MNQAQMMAQVRKMQAEMARAQEELAATVVSGSAGAGMVTVEMTCDYHVKAVHVEKAAIDPADSETLEDLVAAAVNDALVKAQEMSNKRMGALTGGLRLPGLS
jgi:DNA-binding YbaB/EbfC family protein